MSGGIKSDGSWSNWAGNQRSRPVRIEYPTSETEVVDLVQRAASDDLRVRVVGAGHSFTSIARTNDVLVSLDGLTGIEVGRRYGAQGFGPSIYISDPEGNQLELKGPPEAGGEENG